MGNNEVPRPTGELLRASYTLSPKQREVLGALKDFPHGALLDALSDRLGMHINTVRGHLDELVAAQVVLAVAEPAQGRGRPRHRYFARAPRQADVSREYVALVEVLAASVADGGAEAARAVGREWARRARQDGHDASESTDPVGAAAAALREMGFDPVPREGLPGDSADGVSEIGLNACPFVSREGVAPSPAICAMHEGYLRELVGTGDLELRAFDRPGQCGVRVGGVRPAQPPS